MWAEIPYRLVGRERIARDGGRVKRGNRISGLLRTLVNPTEMWKMRAVRVASAVLAVNTAVVSPREPGLGGERPSLCARYG